MSPRSSPCSRAALERRLRQSLRQEIVRRQNFQQFSGFDGRSVRDFQMIPKASLGSERVSLRDVELDRQRRSLKLCKHCRRARLPAGSRALEYGLNNFAGLLPCEQALVVAHVRTLASIESKP